MIRAGVEVVPDGFTEEVIAVGYVGYVTPEEHVNDSDGNPVTDVVC